MLSISGQHGASAFKRNGCGFDVHSEQTIIFVSPLKMERGMEVRGE